MNPENEIDKTEALEPVETAAANVAEARGGVDGRKRPKWLLPLIAAEQSLTREDFTEAQRLVALIEKVDASAPALPRLKQGITRGMEVAVKRTQEETDKVMGLELGADDYITKPFSMRELMARVKANMRRTYAGEDREKAEAPSGGGLRVSKDNGMVYKNGHPLELSAREFDILCFLSAAPGRVFSREELMEQVWGYDYYGDLRAVDVAIRRLREKIEDEPDHPKWIVTLRGVGYRFAAE